MKKPHKFPKQDNPKAKQRELQASWDALLAKHAKPLFSRPVKTPKKVAATQQVAVVRKTSNPLSMMGQTPKAAPKFYTGEKIVGLATMHKSNIVPIFNNEAAVEVAQMRRG
jgi:hypothetical protein